MKTWFRVGVVVAGLALGGPACFAAENAVLKNGFSIRHERREVKGEATRLYLSAGDESFVDVKSAEIERFEKAEEIVPQADSPAPEIQKDLKALIKDASAKTLIDEDFIHSVIRAESSGKSRAVSRKGARGLMQLMPKTATELGVTDAFDEAQNVDAGTRHLRALLDRYNGDAIKALAAYNAGASKVDQYKGVPPYAETRAYVARIVREFNRVKAGR